MPKRDARRTGRPLGTRPGDRRDDARLAHREQRRREARLREARSVSRTPRGRLTFGTIVDAAIPYDDHPAVTKSRPAVIVGVRRRSVLVAPATSNLRPRPTLLRLHDWQAADLAVPTAVRVAIVEVGHADVRCVTGQLADRDRDRLARALALTQQARVSEFAAAAHDGIVNPVAGD